MAHRPRPRRHRRCRRSLPLAAGAIASVGLFGAGQLAAAGSPRGAGGAGWTTYGGGMARTSSTAGPPLHPLRKRWRTAGLGGPIHGEPLVLDGRVLVATETDEVVALSAATGQVRWRRSLGTPVPAGMLPCGDLTPTVGVTSTMAADPATGTVFAAATVMAHGRVAHELDALEVGTGRIAWRRGLDLPGSDPAAELQRGALALAAGQVVVPFGGNYGDCGPYHGEVVAVPESGHGQRRAYVVPTRREGGIWAPSGVAVTAGGDVLAATGNGSSTTAYDSGDSVLELAPSLVRRSSFAPADWATANADDLDLGSSAPMLVPGGRLLVLGKQAVAYLLAVGHLGGIGHPLAAAHVCFSIGGDAEAGGLAYVPCPDGSLTALRIGAHRLTIAWRAPSGVTGSPTVAGGLVWVVGGDHLVGLDPSSGDVVVRMPAVRTEPYAAPSAADGLLVVAGDGEVEAFEGPAGYRP